MDARRKSASRYVASTMKASETTDTALIMEMYALYQSGYTLVEVGRKFSVSKTTVRNRFRRLNLTVRSNAEAHLGKTNPDVDRRIKAIYKQYKAGDSLDKVAAHHGMSAAYLHKAFQARGLEVRKIRSKKEEYLTTDQKQKLGEWSDLSVLARGELAEIRAAELLTYVGLSVWQPIQINHIVDLVASRTGVACRIQVKTASYDKKTDRFRLTVGTKNKESAHIRYAEGAFDFAMVYCPGVDAMYIFSEAQLARINHVNLLPHRPRLTNVGAAVQDAFVEQSLQNWDAIHSFFSERSTSRESQSRTSTTSEYFEQEMQALCPSESWASLDTRVKGSIAELRISAALLENDFDVWTPFVRSSIADLAVLRGGKLIRIQVKAAWFDPSSDNFRVNFTRGRHVKYSAKDVDIIMVYCHGSPALYVIPTDDTSGFSTVRLSPHRAPSNSAKQQNEVNYRNAFHLID